MARVFSVLPLLVAALTLGVTGPEALPPALVAGALVLALFVGPRVTLDKPTQRLSALVIVIVVIAGVRAAGIPARGPKIGAFAFGVALAPLCVAVLRLLVARVEWGYIVTASLGFVTMLACGGARAGPLYGALVVAYLAAMIGALRADDIERVPARQMPRRGLAISAFIVGLACAIAVAGAVALPPLARSVQRRFDRSFELAMYSRIAFADTLRLGAMTRLLESDRVVLRVRGPRVDRLRGAVLDTYDGARWLRNGGGTATRVAVDRPPLLGSDVIEIRKIGDESNRLFLPADFRAIANESGALRVDAYGIARLPNDGADATVWLRPGTRGPLPIAPFASADVAVPSELELPLQSLASQWAQDSRSPEDALAAIESHLRADFRYALHHERKTKLDPMLDFLFEHRVGHCEYFASGMALLARAIGIPARVVTGYRVAERNPALGHWVVREKNAHAWVEAWIPNRGWVTFDPTPNVELVQNELHDEEGWAAVSESLTAGVGRVEAWLAERTLTELTIAALLGLVLFAVVRRFGAKKEVAAPEASAALEFSMPLDAWVAFESALARMGTARAVGEALEEFAARLPSPNLRALALRYARVRYGSAPDDGLARDLLEAIASPPAMSK
jgi:transglutaminase-like putative cysteine protease